MKIRKEAGLVVYIILFMIVVASVSYLVILIKYNIHKKSEIRKDNYLENISDSRVEILEEVVIEGYTLRIMRVDSVEFVWTSSGLLKLN